MSPDQELKGNNFYSSQRKTSLEQKGSRTLAEQLDAFKQFQLQVF